MCDDDWDAPSERAPPKPGVVIDGGCKFSAGRGFTAVKVSDNCDGWGNGANNNGWENEDSIGVVSSWGNENEDLEPERGNRDNYNRGRGIGRGRGGVRGGRGDGRGFNYNDNIYGDRRERGRGGGDSDLMDKNEKKEEKKIPIYIPPEIQEDLFTTGITSGINFMKLSDVEVNITGENPPQPIMSFESSGLRQLLLENVLKSGYKVPTPIQKYSIPAILQGRDLMSCAQTGSGKTAAFCLPIIHKLLETSASALVENNCAQPQVIILSPTRELAIQIYEQVTKFAYNSFIKVVKAYGGTSVHHQRNHVLSGCHILVATPGRLKDFISRNYISFASLQYFVLDEADRMLDMGFLPAVEEILSHDSMPATGERQTLMFSATFPEEVQELATKFLFNYIFLAVGIVGSASTDVEQIFLQVTKFEKREKLLKILGDNPSDRILIFVETKRNADFIATFLSERNIKTTSIHGDRYQKEREEALYDFKKGIRNVLVATGVAARGLDIKDVAHVINFDLPKSIDEYVHRIGRTGRVGNRGKATSFYDSQQDSHLASDLSKILKQANQTIPEWLGQDNFGDGFVDQFGGRDIRGGDFGRAQNTVNNDEEW